MKSHLTPARVLVFSLIAGTVQFGLAMIVLGGWTAFFSHPALIVLAVATLGMMFVAPFRQSKPEFRRKGGSRQPLGLRRPRPNRVDQRHPAALYRSAWTVDHRRRNNSLDRRDSVCARRSTATVAGLCAGFAVQWVGDHPVGP